MVACEPGWVSCVSQGPGKKAAVFSAGGGNPCLSGGKFEHLHLNPYNAHDITDNVLIKLNT